jgi:hypothetical protein
MVTSLKRRQPPGIPESLSGGNPASLPGVAAATPHSVVTQIPPSEKAWDAF